MRFPKLFYQVKNRISRPWRRKLWTSIDGQEIGEDISIDSLICPLRYDIKVRIDFLKYYEGNKNLFADDFDTFASAPQIKPYYCWYKDMHIPPYYPWLRGVERRIRPMFRDKVKRTVALYESIKNDGFDSSQRIRIQTGSVIKHKNNKHVSAKYYAGDGCHRLACVYALGERSLRPDRYFVSLWKEFVPLDITILLAPQISLARKDYLRFISSYYCDGNEFAELEDMVDYLKQQQPGRLDEVLSVVNEDMKYL